MHTAKVTGMPIMEGMTVADDLPYTVSYAINYRAKINSLQELPKDKRPPRNLWDKPHKLEEFLEEAFSVDGKKKDQQFIEYDTEDVD